MYRWFNCPIKPDVQPPPTVITKPSTRSKSLTGVILIMSVLHTALLGVLHDKKLPLPMKNTLFDVMLLVNGLNLMLSTIFIMAFMKDRQEFDTTLITIFGVSVFINAFSSILAGSIAKKIGLTESTTNVIKYISMFYVAVFVGIMWMWKFNGWIIYMIKKITWKEDRVNNMFAVGMVGIFVVTTLAFIFYGHTLAGVGDVSAKQRKINQERMQISVLVLFIILFGGMIWTSNPIKEAIMAKINEGGENQFHDFKEKRHMVHTGLLYIKVAFVLFLFAIATINSYTEFMTRHRLQCGLEILSAFACGWFMLFFIMLIRKKQTFPHGVLSGSYNHEQKRTWRRNVIINCTLFGVVSVLFYLFSELSGMNAVGFTILPKQPPPPVHTMDPNDDANTQKLLVVEKRLEIQILGGVAVLSIAAALCAFLYIGGYSIGLYNATNTIQSNPALSANMKASINPVIDDTSPYTEFEKRFGRTLTMTPSTFTNTGTMIMEALCFAFFFNLPYLLVSMDRNPKSMVHKKSFWITAIFFSVIAPTILMSPLYIPVVASGVMDHLIYRIDEQS